MLSRFTEDETPSTNFDNFQNAMLAVFQVGVYLQRFSVAMTAVKPKPKSSHCPITKDKDNQIVNQSKFKANTCYWPEARENVRESVTILASRFWFRFYFWRLIKWRSNVKPNQKRITFNSRMKIALSYYLIYVSLFIFLSLKTMNLAFSSIVKLFCKILSHPKHRKSKNDKPDCKVPRPC